MKYLNTRFIVLKSVPYIKVFRSIIPYIDALGKLCIVTILKLVFYPPKDGSQRISYYGRLQQQSPRPNANLESLFDSVCFVVVRDISVLNSFIID